jgi:hypothetical protein
VQQGQSQQQQQQQPAPLTVASTLAPRMRPRGLSRSVRRADATPGTGRDSTADALDLGGSVQLPGMHHQSSRLAVEPERVDFSEPEPARPALPPRPANRQLLRQQLAASGGVDTDDDESSSAAPAVASASASASAGPGASPGGGDDSGPRPGYASLPVAATAPASNTEYAHRLAAMLGATPLHGEDEAGEAATGSGQAASPSEPPKRLLKLVRPDVPPFTIYSTSVGHAMVKSPPLPPSSPFESIIAAPPGAHRAPITFSSPAIRGKEWKVGKEVRGLVVMGGVQGVPLEIWAGTSSGSWFFSGGGGVVHVGFSFFFCCFFLLFFCFFTYDKIHAQMCGHTRRSLASRTGQSRVAASLGA